ncbi:hypothetical protein JOD53_002039 [Brevibacterium luteolum]|nr:hypothetical protein [Brevibacterium luteolum]
MSISLLPGCRMRLATCAQNMLQSHAQIEQLIA